ncbi:Pyruvate/Phosphoenolpyruvate kinase-like domain-containing protein [Mycena crocata]|nr:Pyruvate/Phosphoenolpyruvate kinase-like domain-containing protein [Mycena crocata]
MSADVPRFTLTSASQGQHRAPYLQHASNLQALLKTGKILIGNTLSYPSTHVAKTVAATGADICWVDAEHVAWSTTLLAECIQIIIHESGGKMIPIVRVPSKTAFDYMAWCLDAGAAGIIIPHLETVEEMKKVINACRFPPIGHRSFPPFTFIPGVTDFAGEGETLFSLANKHIAIIPQIESRLGIQNMEAIMAMPEISAFMIGTGDLRLDMGLSVGVTGTEPEYVAAIEKATKIGKERDLPLVGAALGAEMIKMRIDEGYRILVCCFDFYTLSLGMITTLSDARKTAEEYMQNIHSS